MNLSLLCIIPEYICHMGGTWCHVRRSALVLWKEEEQVKKSISSKRDDQTRVRGDRESEKPHISQLTSASLCVGGGGAFKVGDHYSFKEHFLISVLTATILFSYFQLCLLLEAGATAVNSLLLGLKKCVV